MAKYRVLTIEYTPAGRNEYGDKQYAVSWKQVGLADSFADAKQKFGGYPVLEENK